MPFCRIFLTNSLHYRFRSAWSWNGLRCLIIRPETCAIGEKSGNLAGLWSVRETMLNNKNECSMRPGTILLKCRPGKLWVEGQHNGTWNIFDYHRTVRVSRMTIRRGPDNTSRLSGEYPTAVLDVSRHVFADHSDLVQSGTRHWHWLYSWQWDSRLNERTSLQTRLLVCTGRSIGAADVVRLDPWVVYQ